MPEKIQVPVPPRLTHEVKIAFSVKSEPLRGGANRIEILAMITRVFSGMMTRVSLDLIVRWLPMSLQRDHSM